MFLVAFIVTVAVVGALHYYLLHYHTAYFKRRGIPSVPITKPLWNHLEHFTSRQTPFYFHYDEWTKQFGKFFGFFLGWRKVLMISDLEAVQDVLYRQFENFDQRMIIPLERLDHWFGRRYIMSATGNQYRRIRALTIQCFTPANSKRVCPKVDQAAKDFIQILEEKQSQSKEPIVIQNHVLEFIMDVLCKLALGTEECLQFKNPYVDKVENLMSSYSRTRIQQLAYLFTPINTLWIPFYELYNKIFPDTRFQMITDLCNVIFQRKKQKEELLAKGITIEHRDFIDMMIDAEDDSLEDSKFEKKLTFQEVIINSTVLVAGGLETTTGGALSTIRCLMEYPHYQQLIRDEIRDYFDDDSSEPIFDQLKNMKLLEAFIKESLRLHPPAPQTVNRRTVRDTVIGDGLQIERGTYIFVNTRAIQRDEKIWGEDALEFRPERFFELTPQQNSAYLPFGAGPRICPGITLGYMAIKLIVIRLLQKFSLKPTPMMEQEVQNVIPFTTTTVRIKKLTVSLEPHKS